MRVCGVGVWGRWVSGCVGVGVLGVCVSGRLCEELNELEPAELI